MTITEPESCTINFTGLVFNDNSMEFRPKFRRCGALKSSSAPPACAFCSLVSNYKGVKSLIPLKVPGKAEQSRIVKRSTFRGHY